MKTDNQKIGFITIFNLQLFTLNLEFYPFREHFSPILALIWRKSVADWSHCCPFVTVARW
jgi:hypothetical protein